MHGDWVWLLVYVNDILVMGESKAMVRDAKQELSNVFRMKYLGVVSISLGVELTFCSQGFELEQTGYTVDIPKSFGMGGCTRVTTPMSPMDEILEYREESQCVKLPFR